MMQTFKRLPLSNHFVFVESQLALASHFYVFPQYLMIAVAGPAKYFNVQFHTFLEAATGAPAGASLTWVVMARIAGCVRLRSAVMA